LEFDQHSVTSGLDDSTPAFGDRWVDHLQPHRLEPRKGPRLIDLHETAIADHICRKNRGEPTHN
jgi:hypothetical protein